MKLKQISLKILILFMLTSCGFKPMLAKNPQGEIILDHVQLVSVEGYDQPRLHHLISKEFQEYHHPKYQLNINVSEEISSIGTMNDGSTTRYKVKVTFNYNLVILETQETVDRGTVFLYSSYDVPQSEFANYISERHISDNLIKELCSELKSRIILVLSSREKL